MHTRDSIKEYWWISQQKLSKQGKNKRTYTNTESKTNKQTNKQNQSIENSTPGKAILQKWSFQKDFSENQRLRKLTASVPALQESLKGVLPGENNDTN